MPLGLFNQLSSVLVEGIVGGLRVICCHIPVATDLRQNLKKSVPVDTKLLKDVLNLSVRLFDNCHKQVLNRDVGIPKGLGLILSRQQRFIEICSDIGLPA